MKTKIIVIALACLLLGSLSAQAQRQTTPRTIEFAKLSDYVNDSDHRRDGERLIVTDVPPIGPLTYEKRNKIYYFRSDESGDVGSTFHTSPALAKSLRQHLKLGDYLSVLIYCTLVQFVGDQDVYRSPFVTKVEGFDGHGRLAWTAVGPQPAKLKMPQ